MFGPCIIRRPRLVLLSLVAIAVAGLGCEEEPLTPLFIAPGTELVIALEDPLSSELSRIGEDFDGRLVEPITVPVSGQGAMVIPRGSAVRGRVLEVVPSRTTADQGARMSLVLRALRSDARSAAWQDLRTLPLRLITLGPTERNEVLPTTGGPAQRLTILDVLSAPTGESFPLPAEANEIVLRRGQRMRFVVIDEQMLQTVGERAAADETSEDPPAHATDPAVPPIATESPRASETARTEQ